MSPPGTEAGGSANAAREKLPSNPKIVPFNIKNNGSDSWVGDSEKERLWQEFRRTRKASDFNAFVRHVVGRQICAVAFDNPILLSFAEAMLRQIGGPK